VETHVTTELRISVQYAFAPYIITNRLLIRWIYLSEILTEASVRGGREYVVFVDGGGVWGGAVWGGCAR